MCVYMCVFVHTQTHVCMHAYAHRPLKRKGLKLRGVWEELEGEREGYDGYRGSVYEVLKKIIKRK